MSSRVRNHQSEHYTVSYCQEGIRGNATQILNFHCRLTLTLFHLFQTFGNILAIIAIWSAYLAKFLSSDDFVYFYKQKKIASHYTIAFVSAFS